MYATPSLLLCDICRQASDRVTGPHRTIRHSMRYR